MAKGWTGRGPHGRGQPLQARHCLRAAGDNIEPLGPCAALTSFLLKYFSEPSRSVSTNFRLKNCPLSRPRFQRKPSRYPGERPDVGQRVRVDQSGGCCPDPHRGCGREGSSQLSSLLAWRPVGLRAAKPGGHRLDAFTVLVSEPPLLQRLSPTAWGVFLLSGGITNTGRGAVCCPVCTRRTCVVHLYGQLGWVQSRLRCP